MKYFQQHFQAIYSICYYSILYINFCSILYQYQSSPYVLHVSSSNNTSLTLSLQMQHNFLIEQIHEAFLSLLQLTNNPTDVIIKPFIRYYVQKQLIKKELDKSLCLSSDIAILTNQLKKKFRPSFQFQNKTYQRHNKYYLYGLKLPPQLNQQHEHYKNQYIENRKEKYRQTSQERIYQNQLRKYIKKPQPYSKYIKRQKGKRRGLNFDDEQMYSPENKGLLDAEQRRRIQQAAVHAINNLKMNKQIKIKYSQVSKPNENYLIERVKELEEKVRILQKTNKFLVKKMENSKCLKHQYDEQN